MAEYSVRNTASVLARSASRSATGLPSMAPTSGSSAPLAPVAGNVSSGRVVNLRPLPSAENVRCHSTAIARRSFHAGRSSPVERGVSHPTTTTSPSCGSKTSVNSLMRSNGMRPPR